MRKAVALAWSLGVTLWAGSFHAASGAEIILVNASAFPLEHFYVVPCGAPHWGADQLGGVPVPPSRHFTVSNIREGCYDLRVILPPWNQCTVAGEYIRGTKAWAITWSTAFLSTNADCSYVSHYVSSGRRPWQPGP
jgi:hypothetical protein